MKTVGWIIQVVPLIAFVATGAVADVVELRTGERVEGEFKEATPAGVVVETAGQRIRFEFSAVRAIYLGPAPRTVQPTSARAEAIKALAALRSATRGPITYRDYAPRVTDARVIVDRYLSEPSDGASPLRPAARSAIGLYDFAAAVWNVKIATSEGAAALYFENDPRVNSCPALRSAWQTAMPARGKFRDSDILIPTIWSCASDKVDEAERPAE